MELEVAAQNKQLKHRIIDILLLIVVVALYFTQWINFPYKLRHYPIKCVSRKI